jgi:addiction module RelE/StbE family toxin
MVFLPEAMADAEEIQRYLSQYYESTVRNFFTLLKGRIDTLKSNPYMAPAYPRRPEYRQLVVEDYLVFYKVDEDKKLIEIHRILHGSRDIGRFIK